MDIAVKTPGRNIRFTQHRNFQKTLNERVNAYLRDNGIPARDVPAMYIKSGVLLAWWLAAYLLLLFGHFSLLADLALCLLWSLAIVAIGFNIIHDANHGGYSNHPRINKFFSLFTELLGFSGFRWRVKHNIWHHTYTNIAGYDDDVETFGTVRLTPRAPWKPIHRAQVWYFLLVYSMTAFDFLLRDFMMALFSKSDTNHVYPKLGTEDKITFWLGKLLFFSIMFVFPMLVYPWWQVIIGFVFVMLTVSVILSVIFQLAHINGDTVFPEPVGDPQHIDNEWAMHQVETTADFAHHNGLLTSFIGGLNYQIEHHLLPHICHLNYPRIAPIVRATCEEFSIRYTCYPTWRAAFACHLRELRRLGRKPASIGSMIE